MENYDSDEKFVRKFFYFPIDDLTDGENNSENVFELFKTLKIRFLGAQFHLEKWWKNDPILRDLILKNNEKEIKSSKILEIIYLNISENLQAKTELGRGHSQGFKAIVLKESFIFFWKKWYLIALSWEMLVQDSLDQLELIQQHGFNYTSFQNYGAQVFLRCICQKWQKTFSLVAAKAKLTPMKPPTITKSLWGNSFWAELL